MKRIFLTLVFTIILLGCHKVKKEQVEIYVPATPASIPMILASQKIPNTKITVFTNHPKAHALFRKNKIQVLMTGLSVGLTFQQQKHPLKMIHSYVSGITYLLTNVQEATSINDLKGKTIHIPFENSPIEQVTRFFLSKQGLEYKKDVSVAYSLPVSSKKLLETGHAQFVPLPEALVSILVNNPEIKIIADYKKLWNEFTGSKDGYPQVATFVQTEFLDKNQKYVQKLNQEVEKAIVLCQKAPEQAVQKTQSLLKFPPKILLASLQRVSFRYTASKEMKKQVQDYYTIIGQPLYDSVEKIFYVK